MKIPYFSPSLELTDELKIDIEHILDSGWVSIGKNVELLENYFKNKYNVKYAIATNNCTQGLIIALKAAGWRNKKILVPSFTWPSTIYAIESNIGNEVVFGDIDPKTWHLDINSINEKNYDVILAMDTFGSEFNTNTKKPLIIDAAHGFDNPNLGHRALAEVVSFSFTKIVTATEGGMILTNDRELYEVAKELRRLSARMNEINACIALKSIYDYERKNKKRRLEIIENYKKHLNIDYKLQVTNETNHSVFSILLPSTFIRDKIVKALIDNEIEYKTYYEPLVEGLHNTDWLYGHIISLPLYAKLKDSEIKYICSIVNKAGKEFTPGVNYLKHSGYLKHYLEREV